MMVVMLILSVILAAMAPVMTTRYKSKPNDSSPWKYEANNRLNAYFGGPNSIAMIGQNEFAEGTDEKAKLLIKIDDSEANYSFLAFKRGNRQLGRLYINNDGGMMFGSTTGILGANANSVGRMSEASGTNATAFGSAAKANKVAATAVGSSVTASGVSSLAVGTSSNATADNSIAIGNAANGSGASAVAIGQSLTGSGANSVTIGQTSTGSGASSIAIGNTATGSGTSSISLGASSIASATNSIAIGDNAKVEDLSTTILSNGAIAIGQGTKAKAERAIAIGNGAKISHVDEDKLSTGSIAIGATNGDVTGEGSIAIGDNVQALGSTYKDGYASVISIGKNASAVGYHTIAIGENAKAQGYSNKFHSNGSMYGDYNSNWGFSSIAIGANANAIVAERTCSGSGCGYKSNYKTNAIAIGTDAKANAVEAMAIGINAEADANSSGSLAIGYNAKANTPRSTESMGYSVAIGANATATGPYSIAIGSGSGGTYSNGNVKNWTQASGTKSIAIGSEAFARGNNSISIGTGACKYVTGANKICIGSYGPGGGTHNNWASDNVERIFIGGRSRFNGETSVLEIHNETSRYNVDSGGQSANNPEPTVVINGNLLVRGFLATGLQEHNSNYLAQSGATKVVRDNHEGWELQWSGPSLQIPDKVYQHSDRRLKYVGKENKSGLDKIRQLKVFNYTFKKDAKKESHVGIIAQDLQKVFPNAVKKGADGFLTIRMEDMFYAVINAIKELDAKYQAQERRINELEKRIEKLEAKEK